MAMTTQQEIIDFCLTFPHVYVDHPFSVTGQPGVTDYSWTVMRVRGNKRRVSGGSRQHNPDKIFVWIFEREYRGKKCTWINVKDEADWLLGWREMYPQNIIPGYHLSKAHWNSVILDGALGDDTVMTLIECSYRAITEGAGWRHTQSGSDAPSENGKS